MSQMHRCPNAHWGGHGTKRGFGLFLTAITAVALLITGCGTAPPEVTPEPTSQQPRAIAVVAEVQATATTQSAVTSTPVPTGPPAPATTPTPTATSRPAATPTPSPTPTVDPVVLDDLQKGYVALVMLEASTGALEELAAQMQQGSLEGIEAGGRLLGLAMIVDTIKGVIDAEAPTLELVPAWAEARQALAVVTGVVSKWFNKTITSADVAGMLAPARKHQASALVIAETLMKNEYGVTVAQLAEYRRGTEAEFREMVEP